MDHMYYMCSVVYLRPIMGPVTYLDLYNFFMCYDVYMLCYVFAIGAFCTILAKRTMRYMCQAVYIMLYYTLYAWYALYVLFMSGFIRFANHMISARYSIRQCQELAASCAMCFICLIFYTQLLMDLKYHERRILVIFQLHCTLHALRATNYVLCTLCNTSFRYCVLYKL